MKSLPRRPVFKLGSIAIVIAMLAVLLAPALGSVQRAGAADVFLAGAGVKVNTDRLNIRVRPGLDQDISKTMSYGEVIYIAAGPTAADGLDWYQIIRTGANMQVGGPNGWVDGEYLAQIGWAPGTVVQVVDGPVNIRPGASTNQSPIGSLAQDDTIIVTAGPIITGDGHNWYKFTLDSGEVGYVAGEFLGAVDGGGSSGGGSGNGGYQAGDAVIVIDGPLNLRETPGVTGVIKRVEPTGTTFWASSNAVDADGYTWISVYRLGDGAGWVAADFIALDPAGTGGGVEGGD